MNQKIIEIRNLSYHYPDETPALNNITLTIYKGESVALIGPNGAGKTSLLLHLNGVLRGDGDVIVSNKAIRKKNLKEIRTKVGIVFQDPNEQLFMPTIFDDIAFGPLNSGMDHQLVKTKVLEIIKKMGLEKCAQKTPNQLSLGERKKAALATVLVLNPEIIVFDEPSIGLDPGTRRMFIDLLKKRRETKIIATHDLALAWRLCSRVIILNNGKLITEGKAKEILNNKTLLKKHNLY